jgi:mycothiol synthase
MFLAERGSLQGGIVRDFMLRESTPEDAAALAALHTALYPDRPMTAEVVLARDRQRAPDALVGRWVAEVDGQVVGMGTFHQPTHEYAPGRFRVWGHVAADFRRRGIGSALYARVLTGLARYDPRELRAVVRDDQPDGLRFLTWHGYAEILRVRDSRLDVPAFDFAPYADFEARFARSGIAIQTLAELAADTGHDRKLYDLEWVLQQDTPGADLSYRRPFDQWVREEIENPLLPHDGYFLALDGADYIGLSHFWRQPGSPELAIGLTAVLPAYRRRGIALALKLHGIRYAQAVGCPAILTGSEAHNRPMLTLNARLGFVPQPGWITFEKRLPA